MGSLSLMTMEVQLTSEKLRIEGIDQVRDQASISRLRPRQTTNATPKINITTMTTTARRP